MTALARFAFVPATFVIIACAQTSEPPPAAPPPPAVAEIPPPPPATSATSAPQEQPPKKEVDAPLTEEAAAAQCVERSSLAPCVPLFKGSMDSKEALDDGANCTSTCIGARDRRLQAALENALASCKDQYVRSGGKGNAKCQLPKPDKKRDARELSMRFQDALRAAVEKNDAASLEALDATLPLLDADYLASKEPACSKRCRSEGAAALKAGKAGKVGGIDDRL